MLTIAGGGLELPTCNDIWRNISIKMQTKVCHCQNFLLLLIVFGEFAMPT
jgi:hypothetical protein